MTPKELQERAEEHANRVYDIGPNEQVRPGIQCHYLNVVRAYRHGFQAAQAEGAKPRAALEKIAGWQAFADGLYRQSKEMPDCELKHYRAGAAGAYAEAAKLASQALSPTPAKEGEDGK